MQALRPSAAPERLAIVLTLTLGAAVWTLGDCGAAQTDAASPPEPTAEAPVSQRRHVEELEARVEGMQGKLHESALARKTADQARMDAERRLAEGQQALEELQTELENLRTRLAELEQEVSEKTALIERLGSELRTTREKNALLSAQLEVLRERLPEMDSGTLTAEAARKAAANDYATLRNRLEHPHVSTRADAAESVAEVAERLHRHQLRLGELTDAQDVYRVRPGDSLGLIGKRVYGSVADWHTIFEANRHLLDDPDRLTPGMSLVIPRFEEE